MRNKALHEAGGRNMATEEDENRVIPLLQRTVNEQLPVTRN